MLRDFPSLFFRSAEPVPAVERRERRRYRCKLRPVSRLLVKPNLGARLVQVRDVSAAGVGLLSTEAIPPGSRVALLWEYGPSFRHRTLIGHVSHVTAQKYGWLIGCQFSQPLPTPDLICVLLLAGNDGDAAALMS